MKNTNGKLLATDIAECALFVALMVATGTVVKIPTPIMTITFQTLFAVLAGLMLGWKKGVIAMAVYAFMGLLGLPVFTNGGGIFYFQQATFGYILGFIASAFAAGIIRGGNVKAPLWRYVAAAVAACVVDYVFGIGYYIILHFAYFGRTAESLPAIVAGHIGWFLPKDLVLCVLAAVLSFKVVPVIRKGKSKLNTPPDGVTNAERGEEDAEDGKGTV